ncbi:hypothetical protein PoB_001512500 [Plakobranchus ocellatus]|uniref:Uncharacterized protein n=1 Tax=Plakobranchus ocellatus TaxID=259542 RepID=A0AAV3Z098_9GAST|nr:hypothetical protein PoB_001512500 [Plakobranchus ocellatus]
MFPQLYIPYALCSRKSSYMMTKGQLIVRVASSQAMFSVRVFKQWSRDHWSSKIEVKQWLKLTNAQAFVPTLLDSGQHPLCSRNAWQRCCPSSLHGRSDALEGEQVHGMPGKDAARARCMENLTLSKESNSGLCPLPWACLLSRTTSAL